METKENQNLVWFLELFHKYQQQIFNFLYRMTQDYQMTLDLTQEVFLRVYEKRRNLKENSNLSAWIFTIARNLCLNKLREKEKMISLENTNPKIFAGNASSYTHSVNGDGIPELMESVDIQSKVREALNNLTQIMHWELKGNLNPLRFR